MSCLFVCLLVSFLPVGVHFLAFGVRMTHVVSWSSDQELEFVIVFGQCRAPIGRMVDAPSLSCLFACLLVVFYQLVAVNLGI